MHLSATKLFHSVTPTGSGYIYIHGPKFENFSELFHLRSACSASLGLRIILLVANCLPPLVFAAVNGNRLRRCRRSKSIAELGYGHDPCANPTLNS